MRTTTGGGTEGNKLTPRAMGFLRLVFTLVAVFYLVKFVALFFFPSAIITSTSITFTPTPTPKEAVKVTPPQKTPATTTSKSKDDNKGKGANNFLKSLREEAEQRAEDTCFCQVLHISLSSRVFNLNCRFWCGF